ncbi:MAG: TolC family protein [Dysgonamonadaceae bacterium]|jgi:outer membrane protein|nr:TolC family protein [Dysgonamonadaceae bacterium]
MKSVNMLLSVVCRVMTIRRFVLLCILCFSSFSGIQAQQDSIKEQYENNKTKIEAVRAILRQTETKSPIVDQTPPPAVDENKIKPPANDNQAQQAIPNLLTLPEQYENNKAKIEAVRAILRQTETNSPIVNQTPPPAVDENKIKPPANDNQAQQTIPYLLTIPEPDAPYNDVKDKKWTLENCIQYAIDHNINVKQLELQKEDAEILNNTAKNSRLPNLNATTSQEWDFYRTNYSGYDTVYNSKSRSVSNFGLSSSIPLFTGFRIPNEIAKTKLEIQAATENLAKAKEDLSLNITSLFLQVLFYKELLSIDGNQLELSKNQVKRTGLLVEAGSVPKSQLYDIQAQVAKDEVALVEAKNNLDLALIDLAQALELEKNSGFDIYAPEFEGDIINLFIGSLLPPDRIYESAVIIKPGIKGQEYKVESAEKSLKIAEAGYLPQLDLLLSAGTNYLYVYNPEKRFNPLTQRSMEENDSFSDQLKNNNNRIIGFNLTVPIFNRFSVKNQVKRAKIDIQNQLLILENSKKSLYKEIQIAHKNSTASIEKYRSSEKSVQAASLAFNYALKRYELGNSSVYEFNEAKTRYIQSQSELVQSKYEYILRTKILDFYMGVPIKL